MNFNFKQHKGFNKMLVQEINYNKTKEKFNYIQKEFTEIFDIYFNEKNFDKMFNKSLKLSNYYNIDFLNSVNDLTISYDDNVNEMRKIAKYKFSLINEYLNILIDNFKNRILNEEIINNLKKDL